MAAKIPGKDNSLWLATTPKTSYRPLVSAVKTQVAIAGGGIAGLLTGWTLQKEGVDTVIVEKDRIIQNTTGNTTAKLTSQHYLVYDYLISKFGKKTAQAYADANQQAIEDIEAVIRSLGIECDFSRAPAYVYSLKKEDIKDIKAEVNAAKSLGLPASFETSFDLPFRIKGAIKFDNQAQFHPRKFLLAIAKDFVSKGGLIYENTEAKEITPGKHAVLTTDKGKIKADYVVGATKYPFWREEIFDNHTWTKLSYALAVKLKNKKSYPGGMYINNGRPTRSMRTHKSGDQQYLVFGGESHEMTKDYDKDEHYKKLIDDVKDKFEVDKVLFRWIAGDVMPNDRLPIIGRYPREKNIFIITGFHAWGLAWGMAAAEIIADSITNKKNPIAGFFSPGRF